MGTTDTEVLGKPRSRRAAAFVAAALLIGMTAHVGAHEPGLSALSIQVSPDRVVASLSLAAGDVNAAVGSRASEMDAFALDTVALLFDGIELKGVVESLTSDAKGTTVVMAFGRSGGTELIVRSEVARRLSLGHRELLTVTAENGRRLAERMLSADETEVRVLVGDRESASGLPIEFATLGIRHILGGYDHLLFVGGLLLGVRRLRDVASTITAFTVAHSVTLAVAVLGLVQPPAALVEPLIAASIIFVGIENIVREQTRSRWQTTFVFGLIHGFGFAGALSELGIAGTGLAVVTPLALFNAGVEVGQLGVAALLWPVVRGLHARPVLRLRVVPACSFAVVLAGTYWLVERIVW